MPVEETTAVKPSFIRAAFFLNIENLVLWARSEAIRLRRTVDKCLGVMEYWNVGIVGS